VSDLPKSNVGKVLRQKLREKHHADHPQQWVTSLEKSALYQ
jgi:acyl-CoA synthetase (AMP-forming)/AMP-acid ligase II